MTDYTKHWDEIRSKRDRRLAASDWTQMPDSPLTSSKKAEWATYRQGLRSLPNDLAARDAFVSETATNPLDDTLGSWSWPVKPS